MSLVQFQPNPLFEQLLDGKLGCLTTSPLLPNQLSLNVATLAFRPGATISCSVAATERQVLPVATLNCLEVTVKMGEAEVVVENELVGEGSSVLLTFKAVAKGCYKVSACLSSQDVLGSPLNLPVLENPVAALAKLGLEPLPDTGSNSAGGMSQTKQNVASNKSTPVNPLSKSEDLAGNRQQVGKTSKLAKPNTSPKSLASQTSKVEVVSSKSLASQARGEHCFVQHEGEWHAGVLHAVIHESLVTVRNLTLDQYRGVHPTQVVFEEVDLPEGRKLASSALDLLEKKAEEKRTEPIISDGPKKVVKEQNRNGNKDMGELVEDGLKGRGTGRTEAVEQREVKEIKPEPVQEEKLEEDLKETNATESLKWSGKMKGERKDEKLWQEGEKCLARWDEDKVGQ